MKTGTRLRAVPVATSGTCLHTFIRADRSCGVSRWLSFRAPRDVFGHLEPGFSLGSSGHELLRLPLYWARAGEKPLHCNSFLYKQTRMALTEKLCLSRLWRLTCMLVSKRLARTRRRSRGQGSCAQVCLPIVIPSLRGPFWFPLHLLACLVFLSAVLNKPVGAGATRVHSWSFVIYKLI